MRGEEQLPKGLFRKGIYKRTDTEAKKVKAYSLNYDFHVQNPNYYYHLFIYLFLILFSVFKTKYTQLKQKKSVNTKVTKSHLQEHAI